MRETYGRIDLLCNAEKTLQLAEFLGESLAKGVCTDIKVTNKLILSSVQFSSVLSLC